MRRIIILCLCLVLAFYSFTISAQSKDHTGPPVGYEGNAICDQNFAFPMLPVKSFCGNDRIEGLDSPCPNIIINSDFGSTIIDKQTGIEVPYPYSNFSDIWHPQNGDVEVPLITYPIIDNPISKESGFVIYNLNNKIISYTSYFIQIDKDKFFISHHSRMIDNEHYSFDNYLFDKGKIIWEYEDVNWCYISILGTNRIFESNKQGDLVISDLDTMKPLLIVPKEDIGGNRDYPLLGELIDKNEDILVYSNNKEEEITIIDFEKPELLWTLKSQVNYNKSVMNIQSAFINGNMLMAFFTFQSNEKNIFENCCVLYELRTGHEIKRFELKYKLSPNKDPVLIDDIDTAIGFTAVTFDHFNENGYSKDRIVFYDLISGNVKKIIESTSSIIENLGSIYDDGRYFFRINLNSIECYDPFTCELIWRREYPLLPHFQVFDGKMYMNKIIADKENKQYETLSILEGDFWKEVSRTPFNISNIRSWYGVLVNEIVHLIPTSKGVLWLPYDTRLASGPMIIGKDQSEVIKTFDVPKWTSKPVQHPAYAIIDNTLLIFCNSLELNFVNLDTGSIDTVKLESSVNATTYVGIRSVMLADRRYAIVFTSDKVRKEQAHVFDLHKRKYIKSFKFSFNQSYDSCIALVDDWLCTNENILNIQTQKTIEIPNINTPIAALTKKGFVKNIPKQENYYSLSIVNFDGSEETVLKNYFYRTKGFYSLSNDSQIILEGCAFDYKQHNTIQNMFYQMPRIYPYKDGLIVSSMNGKGGMSIFKPCPSFSVKKVSLSENSVTIEFENTRQDGLADELTGEAYLANWGDDNSLPVISHLDEPRRKFGPLNIKEQQTLSFKLPEPLNLGSETIGEYCFALIVESNGLLDTRNSKIKTKDNSNLFEGIPLMVDRQKSLVIVPFEK